jgi:hypothetical protein
MGNKPKHLDKRTKEYKEYVKEQESKSKGFGDSIEKVTEGTGIKKAVKFIAGEDCGCDERKDKLNELMPYDTPECLTEDEFNYLNKFFNNVPEKISESTQNKLLEIHNRIFKNKLKFSTCCVGNLIKRLRKVSKAYKE